MCFWDQPGFSWTLHIEGFSQSNHGRSNPTEADFGVDALPQLRVQDHPTSDILWSQFDHSQVCVLTSLRPSEERRYLGYLCSLNCIAGPGVVTPLPVYKSVNQSRDDDPGFLGLPSFHDVRNAGAPLRPLGALLRVVTEWMTWRSTEVPLVFYFSGSRRGDHKLLWVF